MVAEADEETAEETAEATLKAFAQAIGKAKESNVKSKPKAWTGKKKEKIEARLNFLAQMYETKKNERDIEDDTVEEDEEDET